MAAQGRPMRADARRNYERLLSVAKDAFKERGTDASLEDIARRAGVGIGTLYRHFPDRFALMGDIFQTEVDALREEAKALKAQQAEQGDSALEVLTAWLRRYITYASTFRGISKALLDEGLMHACHMQLMDTVNELVEDAHAAGELNADASPKDVLRLASAIAYSAEQSALKNPQDTGVADRLLALALEGLRTRPR